MSWFKKICAQSWVPVVYTHNFRAAYGFHPGSLLSCHAVKWSGYLNLTLCVNVSLCLHGAHTIDSHPVLPIYVLDSHFIGNSWQPKYSPCVHKSLHINDKTYHSLFWDWDYYKKFYSINTCDKLLGLNLCLKVVEGGIVYCLLATAGEWFVPFSTCTTLRPFSLSRNVSAIPRFACMCELSLTSPQLTSHEPLSLFDHVMLDLVRLIHFTPRPLTGLVSLDRHLKPLGQFACPLDLAVCTVCYLIKFNVLFPIFFLLVILKVFLHMRTLKNKKTSFKKTNFGTHWRHNNMPALREAS